MNLSKLQPTMRKLGSSAFRLRIRLLLAPAPAPVTRIRLLMLSPAAVKGPDPICSVRMRPDGRLVLVSSQRDLLIASPRRPYGRGGRRQHRRHLQDIRDMTTAFDGPVVTEPCHSVEP